MLQLAESKTQSDKIFAGKEDKRMRRSYVMRSVGQHLAIVLILVQAGGLYDCFTRFKFQQLGCQSP